MDVVVVAVVVVAVVVVGAPEKCQIGLVFAYFFTILGAKNIAKTDDFSALEAENHDIYCVFFFLW